MRLNLQNISNVYSGKPGCACGCRGKYTYATQFRSHAPDYCQDDPKLCNDRVVKQIVGKIEMLSNLDCNLLECVTDEFVSIYNQDRTRVYVAYFATPDPDFAREWGRLDYRARAAARNESAKAEEVRIELEWGRSAGLHW